MIELRNLTKRFGDFTAVDSLSLTIGTGEFFGLLGSNGAGKTTTISMISTVLLPTEGEILIDGEKITRKASTEKRKLAIVTQEYSMRQDMTMDEVMEYQGRLYFLPGKEIRRKTEELLAFAGLLDYRKRIVRHLSGGMKRKLMICRALMTDPQIILLDEPTAGMDAFARRQMDRADDALYRGSGSALRPGRILASRESGYCGYARRSDRRSRPVCGR